MRGTFTLLVAFGLSCQFVRAQEAGVLTLDQCIEIALGKNVDLRQTKFSAEAAGINLKQAQAKQIPELYGTIDHSFDAGRNIDPFTNQYVDQKFDYGVYGVTSNVVLFNGGNIRNTIRQSEITAIAANKDVQQSNNQVTLNVVLSYLLVLSTEEQLELARTQAALSNEQLTRMDLKKKKGVAALSQVTDLKGQLLNDNLAIVDLQNTLEWNKMELCQQMNVPYNKDMRLQEVDLQGLMKAYQQNSQEIYTTALGEFAQIKAAELRTKAAEYGVKAARGQRLPVITGTGNVNTAYVNAPDVVGDKTGFGSQFANNRGASLLLSVRIPIFASSIKNNIALADINLRNSKLAEEKTKMVVWQQIERAYVAMTNAFTKYRTLSSQLDAYTVSFKAAQARFETGIDGSSVNYLIAKNNLDRANINLINAKYDLVLKTKTLDFYQNIK